MKCDYIQKMFWRHTVSSSLPTHPLPFALNTIFCMIIYGGKSAQIYTVSSLHQAMLTHKSG